MFERLLKVLDVSQKQGVPVVSNVKYVRDSGGLAVRVTK